MSVRHILLSGLLIGIVSGCASTAGDREHPKLAAMRRLVTAMGTNGGPEPVGGKAVYVVSIAPEGVPFRRELQGEGRGFEFHIYSSARTIDGATAATVFEAYATAAGELRTGASVYLWRGGEWVDELDALLERNGIGSRTTRRPATGPAGPETEMNVTGFELTTRRARD